MNMAITITPIFIALFAVAQIAAAMAVGLFRVKHDIHYLDGGNERLLRRIRAHGNFTENVPIALLAMAAAEVTGASDLVLWIGGGTLVVGRAMHYYVTRTSGWGILRSLSMTLTFVALLIFAVVILIRTFS